MFPWFAFTDISQAVPSETEARVIGFSSEPLSMRFFPRGMVSLSAAAVPKEIFLPAFVQIKDSTVMREAPVMTASSSPTNSIAPPLCVRIDDFAPTEIAFETFKVKPETILILPLLRAMTCPKSSCCQSL